MEDSKLKENHFLITNEQLLQSLDFLKSFAHNSNLNEWFEPNIRLKNY